jgi:NADH dehydrogenase
MGAFVADLIKGDLSSRDISRPVFRYRNKGSLATIGRGKAVADIGLRTYGGVLAWIIWSLVHIAFLVGFRNRAFVMAAWGWKYLARVEGARLITGDGSPSVKRPAEF